MASSDQKKLFLIFVEGMTDSDCLSPVMNMFMESMRKIGIAVVVKGTDIFTSKEYIRDSGKTILEKMIKSYMGKNTKVYPKDILHVAFVTDTDGFSVNVMDYLISKEVDKFEYDLENKKILCQDEQKKREILDSRQTKARKLSQIIKPLSDSYLSFGRNRVDYSLYFNALNLEYVLYGEILYIKEEKVDAMDDFLDSINEDPYAIINAFRNKSLSDDYEESWELIKGREMEGGYTNLNILFDRLEGLACGQQGSSKKQLK